MSRLLPVFIGSRTTPSLSFLDLEKMLLRREMRFGCSIECFAQRTASEVNAAEAIIA